MNSDQAGEEIACRFDRAAQVDGRGVKAIPFSEGRRNGRLLSESIDPKRIYLAQHVSGITVGLNPIFVFRPGHGKRARGNGDFVVSMVQLHGITLLSC